MSYALTAREDGGFRHVMRIALPMVLSTSSATIMSFVDRMFLGWYSSDAMASALAAGITCWTFLSFFIGTTSYTSTFVAQYFGAGRKDRVPAAVWQGVFFAAGAGMTLACAGIFADRIMGIAGHPPAIMRGEVTYFRIMMLGGICPVASSALSGFYSGLGRTRVVMSVEIAGNAVNLVLDYVLIFGKWGFPAWGIAGAAVATVTSGAFIVLAYVSLLLAAPLGREFRVLRAPRFEMDLFARLIRYGFPNGLGWMVDAGAWAGFIWLIGRIGQTEIQAMSATFAINHLAFFPMVGFSAATSILVGQFIGAGRPDTARKATYTAFAATIAYMTVIAAVFVVFPGWLVGLFRPENAETDFAPVVAMATVLLRFVAFYSIFDSGNLIFSAALKGAGDTRFVMFMILSLSITLLIIPSWVAVEVLDAGIYVTMAIGTAYVILLAAAYYLRFLAGRWRSMRVIEAPPPMPQRLSDGPVIEA